MYESDYLLLEPAHFQTPYITNILSLLGRRARTERNFLHDKNALANLYANDQGLKLG